MSNGSDKSYYDVLRVKEDASPTEIKNSYRKIMRECHPDKLPEEKKEWGEKMTKEVNEAWEVLKDPEKREKYDKYGKEGPGGPGMHGGMHDMNDIINEMMRQAHGKQKRGQNIPPVKIVQNITLEDVYNGKKLSVNAERYTLCKQCDATGFSDKQKHNCQKCKGSGFVTHTQSVGPGFVQQFQQPCNVCSGSGSDTTSSLKCSKCKGQQITKENKVINVEIPKGVKDRDVIQILNEGNEIPLEDRGKDGVTRGPVHIIINELDHPVFKRGIVINQKMDPSNICIIVDVALADAIAGFKQTIEHLDGRKLYFTESKVIKDGDTGIILNEGLPVKGKDYIKGNLFIKYNVKFPDELSDEQRSGIYKILTGNDYEDVDLSDEYTHVEKQGLDAYGSHSAAYESDSDEDHGGPGECRTQ